VNEHARVSFRYNSLGLPVEERCDEHLIKRSYDKHGLIRSLQSSLGAQLSYERNEYGELICFKANEAETNARFTSEHRYDSLGLELERLLPGGVSQSFAYDNIGRLVNSKTRRSAEQRRSRHYNWGSADRLLSIEDDRYGLTQYSYSPSGELTMATYADGTKEYRLSDKVGLSYGLSGTTRRGYFYNETRQAYQDSLRMVGGFAKLEYRPTEQLEMALSLSGDYVQQGGFPYRTDDPRTKQPLPLSADAPESYKRHTATLRYLLSYKWGGVQLQSATSYQYLFDETQMDMDALPLSYFHVTQGLREHGLTQEFILKNLRGERPSRYDWSVGLFGYHDAKRVEAPVTFSYGGLSALINQAMAALKQRVPAMPSLVYYDATRSDRTNANDFRMPDWGLALYHESAYHLTPAWTITGGLRLDYEHHEISYDSRGYELSLAVAGTTQALATAPPVHLEGKQSVGYWNLLPKLSVTWHPTEALRSYATVSRGVKTGGFNEQSFSDLITTAQQKALQAQISGRGGFDSSTIASATTYKPEHSWSYELGARYALPSAGLELSSSVYLMQVRDLQLTRFVASGAGRMVGNAGSSRTLGFELSATQRLWSSLRAHLNYSLTDARFTEETTAAKKGNFVPFIPRHTYSVMLSANEPLSRHLRLLGEVEYAGLGEIYWREDNTTRESLQSTLRARLGLSYDRYTLAFWGANLTDNSYTVFQAASPLGRLFQTSAPRTLGVDLSVKF